ncbi:hypothetical protein C8R45DRAFT_947145 [Mycena sanguinolenta]|nr:hypothetical protein C8R45DRAFT_947145 [Mycena sanguinolenta]
MLPDDEAGVEALFGPLPEYFGSETRRAFSLTSATRARRLAATKRGELDGGQREAAKASENGDAHNNEKQDDPSAYGGAEWEVDTRRKNGVVRASSKHRKYRVRGGHEASINARDECGLATEKSGGVQANSNSKPTQQSGKSGATGCGCSGLARNSGTACENGCQTDAVAIRRASCSYDQHPKLSVASGNCGAGGNIECSRARTKQCKRARSCRKAGRKDEDDKVDPESRNGLDKKLDGEDPVIKEQRGVVVDLYEELGEGNESAESQEREVEGGGEEEGGVMGSNVNVTCVNNQLI